MRDSICLFDSGIGGLTVLKRLVNDYPNENYIYLADLANVPFGDKSSSEIESIATGIIHWLSRFNPKLIIMACNTSSTILSTKQSAISNQLNVPIYGMIGSCAKEIAGLGCKKISVWATKLVVENNGYKKAINKLNTNIEVEEIACPKLVPMIESLNYSQEEKNKILEEYLNKTSSDSEALILGCTHYPLIEDDIKNLRNVKTLDPACELIKDLCKNNHLSNNSSQQGSIQLYATRELEKLTRFAKIYLGKDFLAKNISLSKTFV